MNGVDSVPLHEVWLSSMGDMVLDQVKTRFSPVLFGAAFKYGSFFRVKQHLSKYPIEVANSL